VVPFGQRISSIARGKHGSHGQAAGHGLGQGHDIGLDRKMVLAEPLPRAPESGLYLIEYEQSIPVVAYLTSSAQVIGFCHIDPRLTLHRLEDDRTRI